MGAPARSLPRPKRLPRKRRRPRLTYVVIDHATQDAVEGAAAVEAWLAAPPKSV